MGSHMLHATISSESLCFVLTSFDDPLTENIVFGSRNCKIFGWLLNALVNLGVLC